MPISNKFFKFPFAESGDLTPIPDNSVPDGTVSYEEGFGFDYQRNILTNPSALPVPRRQTNQFNNDITRALRQYQTFGVPNYITPAQNGSEDIPVPFPYEKNAYCVYDDGVNIRIYQSLVASNIALPTDLTKWRWIDNSVNKIVLDNAVFEGTVVNKDVVYWDFSNTRFAKALADNTVTQNVVGIADVTNKRVIAFGVTDFLTGLTGGAIYYLSSVTPGAITTVRPLFNSVIIGIAKSATVLFLTPLIYKPPILTAASVYLDSAIPVLTGVNLDPIPFNQTEYNTGLVWNNTSKKYVIDRAGFYDSTGRLYCSVAGGATGSLILNLVINGVRGKRISELNVNSLDVVLAGSARVLLEVGDQVYLNFDNPSSGTVTVGGADEALSGFDLSYCGRAV